MTGRPADDRRTDSLLLLALLAIPLSWLLATSRWGRWLLVAGYVTQFGLLVTMVSGSSPPSAVSFSLLGNDGAGSSTRLAGCSP